MISSSETVMIWLDLLYVIARHLGRQLCICNSVNFETIVYVIYVILETTSYAWQDASFGPTECMYVGLKFIRDLLYLWMRA
jgi:hypothetical protein